MDELGRSRSGSAEKTAPALSISLTQSASHATACCAASSASMVGNPVSQPTPPYTPVTFAANMVGAPVIFSARWAMSTAGGHRLGQLPARARRSRPTSRTRPAVRSGRGHRAGCCRARHPSRRWCARRPWPRLLPSCASAFNLSPAAASVARSGTKVVHEIRPNSGDHTWPQSPTSRPLARLACSVIVTAHANPSGLPIRVDRLNKYMPFSSCSTERQDREADRPPPGGCNRRRRADCE